ncbi:ATP-binding protein [Pseudomonas nitroreducens]|uniref:ATP-binding protein n=1 Tax=Pseudomonas nitroreducens TaxID=46680 RepID=UPI003908A90A
MLIFGPPGNEKSHLGSAIGHALIDAGYRVLFTRTSELVQKLQAARQNLQLPAALANHDLSLPAIIPANPPRWLSL